MPGQKFVRKQWVLVLVFIILFVMMLGLNARLSEYFRLTGQRDEMQQRIDLLKGTQMALETQIAYASSEKSVEEWARTYERMVQPGDQLIVPLPEKEITPEIKYLPQAEPENTENWQIWMELLFGD
jgi:cell division protein FtsB